MLRFESYFEKLSQQKWFCVGYTVNFFFPVLKTKVSKHSISLHLSLVAKDPVAKKINIYLLKQ